MRSHAIILTLALALPLSACKKEPSRWDQAATAKPSPSASSASQVEKGSSFNAFFPADGADGASRVFTAEKPGYAEARIKKEGKDIATLSISDTASDPEARGKFTSATEKVAGHPLVTIGKTQSAVLVKNRYQVKVSSPTLDAEARKAWIERFNLNGLAGL